ncbi:hypothetical protein D3C84_883380 [compost metagenome]
MNINKARVLSDQMNFMALLTHSLKSGNMQRDFFPRITNTKPLLFYIALRLINDNNCIYRQLIPFNRVLEFIPLRRQFGRIEVGNIVVIDRPILRLGSKVDFLNRVKCLAMPL